MDKQSSSFSRQAHLTTGGSETSQHSSEGKEEKSQKKPVRLTTRQENEIVRLYKAQAGTTREIAFTYNVHISTVYKVLQRKKVKLFHPERSEAARAMLIARHAKRRAEAARAVEDSKTRTRKTKEKQEVESKPNMLKRIWLSITGR